MILKEFATLLKVTQLAEVEFGVRNNPSSFWVMPISSEGRRRGRQKDAKDAETLSWPITMVMQPGRREVSSL